ncbi:hypothetical protein [Desulforhopalus sp. IMCC35007]|uniref:hypothetical protein n=1 Tax=Desulforhopalus sp. IMCC35007 TaxID=2569543 RepID=UPI0010AE27F5|nr:hypothetical protein [Desulforhopalus sp. IMCC35007]TKB07425.1 hypothetical protein FCL48_16930 [Desulforhopalus sp. IMCC35007]
MFSNLRQDLQRYCDNLGYGTNPDFISKIIAICKSPGYWAIVVHRFGFWINSYFGNGYKNPLKLLFKLLYFTTKQFAVFLTKIEILVTADIGPGLFLSNQGNIILGLRRMGVNCTIHHNVTTGQGVEGETPEFGDNIWIGHDSVVYGALSIGGNTIIENGTVLAKSLPDNMVVGGNPCRIRNKNIKAGPYPINYQKN